MLKVDSCEKSFFSWSNINSNIQALKIRVLDTKVNSIIYLEFPQKDLEFPRKTKNNKYNGLANGICY